MITCSIPLAIASSTPYWIVGLSTSGSISIGCALDTGRNRVPSPAAGKMAFRTPATDIGDNLYGERDRRHPPRGGVSPRACGRGRSFDAPRRRQRDILDS